SANVDKIDKDIDVLWLVHPQNLSDKTLYAIDQFVLGGGRALIFVDPLAQIAAPSGPIGGLAGMQRASSNLARLFKAWGVQYSPSQVVTDNVHALSVNAGYGKAPVRHIGLVGIDKASMDQKDVITAGLDSINFADAGYFTKAPKATIKLTPLIMSSKQSSLMPSIKMQFVSDPNQLLNDFVASGQRYAIAARLEGHIDTAFPDGPPAAGSSDSSKTADAAKDSSESEKTAAAKPVSTADAAAKPQTKKTSEQIKSSDKANIVLVADVDMLSDRMWVDRQSFLGQAVVTAFASNGDFVTNALDNLSGSAELIGLKSRATYSRPFTTVDALRRTADARFRTEQQRLQAELTATKKKLSDLQASRSDKTSVLMTPAQQNEMQHFVDQQVQIREQLRKVQHNLNEDIEQLGTRLKIIDIGVMPIALTLIVFGIVYVRRRRPGHGA
ncbi:MAG TPA: Gldg family protein, partial [Gammaproteobacteria bacterium]|nr:Gldg family protein [Gammaproteobacteria bacterium]